MQGWQGLRFGDGKFGEVAFLAGGIERDDAVVVACAGVDVLERCEVFLGYAAGGCKQAVELPGLAAVGRGALEQTGKVFLGLVVLRRKCDPGFAVSGAVTQRLDAFEYVRALGRELGNAGAVLVGEGAFAELSPDTAEGVVKRDGGEWRVCSVRRGWQRVGRFVRCFVRRGG